MSNWNTGLPPGDGYYQVRDDNDRITVKKVENGRVIYFDDNEPVESYFNNGIPGHTRYWIGPFEMQQRPEPEFRVGQLVQFDGLVSGTRIAPIKLVDWFEGIGWCYWMPGDVAWHREGAVKPWNGEEHD